jgi:hypothetical protein
LIQKSHIGSFNDFNLYVYDCEELIPCFHLIKHQNHKVCIKIQQAEYIHYSEVLNPKEKKHLIDFLKSKNKYFSDKTNWQVLVVQWSMNNADFELSPETKMPDYQNL